MEEIKLNRELAKVAEETSQSNEDSNAVALRIAQMMANVKKISERIVGYVPFDYVFQAQTYHATSNRPAKITPLERAIVGILKVDSHQDLITIGEILGLDIKHDIAEKEILNHAVESMRQYGVIEGDDSYLSLTERGNLFASTGERPETFSGDFDLWIDPKHISITSLKNDLKADYVEDIDVNAESLNLTLDAIKNFAEHQASNFQTEKLRFVLSEANLNACAAKHYQLYICFLQSVRDNQITLFVYDDHQQCIMPTLSEQFNQDEDFKVELLDKCLSIECESNDVEVLDNATEKPKEQEEAEQQLINEEDETQKTEVKISVGASDKDGRLHKKALYDSLSFEAELHNIFTVDEADEIWMISPWIGHAFVHQRLPYIKNHLSKGRRIFIAFSKEEANIKAASSHGDMITRSAKKAIADLERNYPTLFFCVQLPAFHTKNVIEKKGEQFVMFTGSFNVLSFSVNAHQKQIRREEMALAHYQMAVNKYEEYLDEFIAYYIDEARCRIASYEKADRDEDIINFSIQKIDTLVKMQGKKELYIDFFNEVDNKQLLAKNSLWNKDVSDLGKQLEPYFNKGGISNKEKYVLEKRFGNLTRRYVALTITDDDKDIFDTLYARFKKLPTGKKTLRTDNVAALGTVQKEINPTLISDLKNVLNKKQKGRRLTNDDISSAKKLSGPQNKLSTETELVQLLTSLNLLSTAIRLKMEKKMRFFDVNNSLKRIIKRWDDFTNLSIHITTYNEQEYVVFDICGVQFRFSQVDLSSEQLATIKEKKTNEYRWDGTLSNFSSGELLDVVLKHS